MVLQELAELVEATTDGVESALEGGQPGHGGGERVGVAVDPEHGEVVAALEERLAVPASAEGGIDHDPGGDGREHGHDLVAHDRLVGEGRFAHSAPPASSPRPSAAIRS